jgi:tetratricopeptide (TPR) repeat protein
MQVVRGSALCGLWKPAFFYPERMTSFNIWWGRNHEMGKYNSKWLTLSSIRMFHRGLQRSSTQYGNNEYFKRRNNRGGSNNERIKNNNNKMQMLSLRKSGGGNRIDEVTKDLLIQNQITEATEKYFKVYGVTVTAMNSLLDFCVLKNLNVHVETIFQEFRQKYPKVTPNVDTYFYLLKALIRCNFPQTIKYIKEMKQMKIKPNSRILDLFLEYYVDSNEECTYNMVILLLRIMHSLDSTPDIHTYRIIINYLSKVDDVKNIEKVIELAEKNSSNSYELCYLMLHSYFNTNNNEKLLSTYNNIMAFGYENPHTLAILISHHIRTNNLKAAKLQFTKFLNYKPLHRTLFDNLYQQFMDYYFKNGDSEKIQELIRELNAKGIRLTSVCFLIFSFSFLLTYILITKFI